MSQDVNCRNYDLLFVESFAGCAVDRNLAQALPGCTKLGFLMSATPLQRGLPWYHRNWVPEPLLGPPVERLE